MGFDRIAAIRADSERISELIGTTPSDARVPGCPDWSFADLVQHIGQVQRFWAANVRQASLDSYWQGDIAAPSGDLATWMRESTDDLCDALAAAGDESPCWTWWGDPMTSGAVARHQVQEAAVHRWDAESAGDTPRPLAADVADDGVAEFLAVMLGEAASGLERPVELVALEGGGPWRAGPDGPPAATVTAPASDLVLLLYGRVAPAAVTIEGDEAAVEALLGSTQRG